MRIPLLTLFVLALATDAQAAQNPVRHGRAMAREFCGRCHAVGLRDSSRHSGALPLRALGQRLDLGRLPRVLQRGISAGHPDMPAGQIQRGRCTRPARLSAQHSTLARQA